MFRSILALTICFCAFAAETDGPRYTASGSLMLPANYREWIFLSAGSGMNYGASAESANPPFENVFVTRPAYNAFLKSGQWPDKTAFVLEIRSSESKGSINVGGHYQAGISGIEVEVKDGGKWTFYGFGATGTEGKPFARNERCYSCHSEHGAVDNTFVQFYPTLIPTARAKGTYKER